MSDRANLPTGLGQKGQNLVRVVIASYFLAVASGLIPGTIAWPLTATFLPEPYAGIAGKAVIFLTAYLVLIGAWLRTSALLLATILFWSSYVENLAITSVAPDNIEDFWRDLALIGALILTYTQTLPRAASRRAALQWHPAARRIKPEQAIAPRRVVMVPRLPAAKTPRPRVEIAEVENIFRDEPETVAIAS